MDRANCVHRPVISISSCQNYVYAYEYQIGYFTVNLVDVHGKRAWPRISESQDYPEKQWQRPVSCVEFHFTRLLSVGHRGVLASLCVCVIEVEDEANQS